jgi:hypothetical protein
MTHRDQSFVFECQVFQTSQVCPVFQSRSLCEDLYIHRLPPLVSPSPPKTKKQFFLQVCTQFSRDGPRYGLRTSLRQGKPNRSPKLLRLLQTEPILGYTEDVFFFRPGARNDHRRCSRDEYPERVGKRWRTVKRWRQNPPVTCRCSRLAVLSLRARQTLRLLKLGIPRSVTVLVRTCPRTY